MEWLLGFVLGFVADAFRSVFLPASTDYINGLLPGSKQKANIEKNTLVLETMDRLKSLGKDPELARHISSSSEDFWARLTSQKEAFVDAQVEFLDSTHMNQIEMNQEAYRRFEVAQTQMDGIFNAIMQSDTMEDVQKDQLRKAQKAWMKFQEEQSEFSGILFAGGSMRPLVSASEREALALQRSGQLKSIYEELLAMRG